MSFFKSINNRISIFTDTKEWRLSSLLFVIFCVVITAENTAEALLIASRGSAFIPRIYILNGISLILSSVIIFFVIDRRRRELSVQVFTVISAVVLSAVYLWSDNGISGIILYLLAYIGKTWFFLLFWVIANDICDSNESKTVFPVVAGGGLLGGLFSSLLNLFILNYFHAEMLVFIWFIYLSLIFFIAGNLGKKHYSELKSANIEEKQENNPLKTVKRDLVSILNEKTVLVMAFVYFLVFVIIFGFDFYFIKVLSVNYTSSSEGAFLFNKEGFLGFKFRFYMLHSTVSILCLFFITGAINKKIGLKWMTFITPSFFLMWFLLIPVFGLYDIFGFILFVQFFRHVLFEASFSPSYQIFFSAFKRKFRGRGKVLMESYVKPFSMFFAGFMVLKYMDNDDGIFYFFLAVSVLLIFSVFYLIRQYKNNLIDEFLSGNIRLSIMDKIIGNRQENLLSYINGVMSVEDLDIKRFAVETLNSAGSLKAFEILRKRYYSEDNYFRSVIAGNIRNFSGNEPRNFLFTLLDENDPKIVTASIDSIRLNPHLNKRDFRNKLLRLCLSENLDISTSAIAAVWSMLDEGKHMEYTTKILEMLESGNGEIVCKAVVLAGRLKLVQTFPLLKKLASAPDSACWELALESVARFDKDDPVIFFLDLLPQLKRADGKKVLEVMRRRSGDFSPYLKKQLTPAKDRRIVFYVVDVLYYECKNTGKPQKFNEFEYKVLADFAMDEIKEIYLDVYLLRAVAARGGDLKLIRLLRTAIREKRERRQEILMKIVTLLDSTRYVLNITEKVKYLNQRDISNIISLFEEFGDKQICALMEPILSGATDREFIAKGRTILKDSVRKDPFKYFLSSREDWINRIAAGIVRELGIEEKYRTYIMIDELVGNIDFSLPLMEIALFLKSVDFLSEVP
ncbi:MAG: hypothetical protein ACLFQK_11510, partial [Fibrobacterota bacterium]